MILPDNLKKNSYQAVIEKNSAYAAWIDTPLGLMIAIADDTYLYLLDFIDRRDLESAIRRFSKKTNMTIIAGKTDIIHSVEAELSDYFINGKIKFKTPIKLIGTDFQMKVWHRLIKIAPGQTKSYADIAKEIEQPSAYRAVARANGTNHLAIIIPCHRVINSSGEIGGYGGGVHRKKWLLAHETKQAQLSK